MKLSLLILVYWLFATGCHFWINPSSVAQDRMGRSDYIINVDLKKEEGQINNIFSKINVWNYEDDWVQESGSHSRNYFRINYPFVESVQFMTATGGNEERDLFLDPLDRNHLSDFDFTRLITALQNVVDQGLQPEIVVGNIPLKYSNEVEIGEFGVNVRPPFDFDLHFNYVKALAEKLVCHFGLEELKNWSWGVLTEYENKDWFMVGTGEVESTMIAYFKLYDYTVAALQEVIGEEHLFVGAHSMTVSEGLWDETEFIHHCANGINYKTGSVGSPLDYLSTSYYDLSPGIPVEGSLTLSESIDLLRKSARAVGLLDLKYGVDEGRVLNGPPDDDRPLTSRVVALGQQGAADAKTFKTMTDLNADWFSSWGLGTERIWNGIPTVSTHIANLGYKMVGEHRVKLELKSDPGNKHNEINGLASFDSTENRIHLMVYNLNNEDLYAESIESIRITLKDVAGIMSDSVRVEEWRVGNEDGNFWQKWVADMKKRGISNESFNWSKYSVEIPANMHSSGDKAFWYSKESEYKQLAALKPVSRKQRIINNKISLQHRLKANEVIFYEIKDIQKLAR